MSFILASASPTRRSMLEAAGLSFQVAPARIDEAAIRDSLAFDQVSPRDIADALAEGKAKRIAQKHPDSRVLGSDQILALGTEIFEKPADRTAAAAQLSRLQGKQHSLFSAAVLYDQGEPIWRFVSEVKLSMHPLRDSEIDAYLDRAWPEVSDSVGAYHAEGLGAQLFHRIDGDWFSVLGLPLLPLLSFFRLRGWLAE